MARFGSGDPCPPSGKTGSRADSGTDGKNRHKNARRHRRMDRGRRHFGRCRSRHIANLHRRRIHGRRRGRTLRRGRVSGEPVGQSALRAALGWILDRILGPLLGATPVAVSRSARARRLAPGPGVARSTPRTPGSQVPPFPGCGRRTGLSGDAAGRRLAGGAKASDCPILGSMTISVGPPIIIRCSASSRRISTSRRRASTAAVSMTASRDCFPRRDVGLPVAVRNRCHSNAASPTRPSTSKKGHGKSRDRRQVVPNLFH